MTLTRVHQEEVRGSNYNLYTDHRYNQEQVLRLHDEHIPAQIYNHYPTRRFLHRFPCDLRQGYDWAKILTPGNPLQELDDSDNCEQ